MIMELRIISLTGLFAFIGFCYLISTNRKAIKWKPVIWGCVLQFTLAVLILRTPYGQSIFEGARAFFAKILSFSSAGSKFVFGPLVDMSVTSKAFGPQNAFIFAVQITGTIIFVSVLMSILYHLGIMQKIVYIFAKMMQKLMDTSGSESLAAAANIFIGQTEAPLVIKPYIEKMTDSEIMAMMTGGMATVTGAIMAVYMGMGIDPGHMLAASFMSAPATLAIAKILVPETKQSATKGKIPEQVKMQDANVLDAACRGASEGLNLSINVMGMLIGFIALIALINYVLGWGTSFFMGNPLTLETLLGYVFSPFAFLMGVPKEDIFQVGSLIGIKTTVTEFIAYDTLSKMKGLNPRSITIATYALCGFANFASIAIQIGGIGALVPSKRSSFAKFGFLSMVGGTIASFMTACIAGVLL